MGRPGGFFQDAPTGRAYGPAMNDAYGHVNLRDVEDMAAKFGLGEVGEARYVREDVGAVETGLSWYRMNPGKRGGFGHRHEAVEEIYVVVGGSGRVKVDDDILDLATHDVVRVAPAAVREFEAGPDGMEVLATGAHRPGDGEMVSDWWTD